MNWPPHIYNHFYRWLAHVALVFLVALIPYQQIYCAQTGWRYVASQKIMAAGMPNVPAYQLAIDHSGRLLMATETGLWRYNGTSAVPVPMAKPTSLRHVLVSLNPKVPMVLAVDFTGLLYRVKTNSRGQDSLVLLSKPEPDANQPFVAYASTKNYLYAGYGSNLYRIAWKHLYSHSSGWQCLRVVSPSRSQASQLTHLCANDKLVVCRLLTGELLQVDEQNSSLRPVLLPHIPASDTVAFGQYLVPTSIGIDFWSDTLVVQPRRKALTHYWAFINGQWCKHRYASTKHHNSAEALHPWKSGYFSGFASTDGLLTRSGAVLLPKHQVSSWLYDAKNQQLWVATLNKGIVLLSSAIQRMLVEGIDLPAHKLQAVHDTSINFWVGDNEGHIYEMNDQGVVLRKINIGIKKEIEFMSMSANNDFLLCSDGIYDIRNKIFRNYYFSKSAALTQEGVLSHSLLQRSVWHAPGAANELVGKGRISDIYPAHALTNSRIRHYAYAYGLLWAAFQDSVVAWKYKAGSLKREVSLAQDKPQLVVMNGQLFMGTQNGLYYWHNGGMTKLNDLPIHRMKSAAPCLYAENYDGTLLRLSFSTDTTIANVESLVTLSPEVKDWLPNRNGLLIAYPEGLRRVSWSSLNSHKPLQVQCTMHLERTDGTLLSFYGASLLLEHISLAELPNPLRYRVLPVQPKWQDLKTSPTTLTLPSLWPSNYELQVASASGSTFSYSFSVPQPWWMTIWAVGSLTLLLLFGGYILYAWLQRRKQVQYQLVQDLRHSQLVALRSQMNPHFLYNLLNSIQGLVYENKPDEASTQISNYANYTRQILEQSQKELIRIQEEVHILEQYLILESQRFGTDFSFNISVDPALKQEHYLMPPMLVQPLVENAVVHGLLHQYGAKKLSLVLALKSSVSLHTSRGAVHLLEVEVEDNGVGRTAAKALRARTHKSFATSALVRRLALLNRQYGLPHKSPTFDMVYHDLTSTEGEAIGTKVILHLPLEFIPSA